MEQVAKPVQIFQKISENCCPCLYLSVAQVWWLNELWFKRYSKLIEKKYILCNSTRHDITDLVNRGIDKIQKLELSWEWNIAFLLNGKINLCLRWRNLRSYSFVADVTIKYKFMIPQLGKKNVNSIWTLTVITHQ